ncbi:MAG: NifU N-terminal domain-containing protein [Acidobacteria bacterium]|nr:NifU N-terminal domain-containing protein [Acidobacteriota bacterium]
MAKSGAGRRSLKNYELTNLFFSLTLIVALGIVVTFVFRYYGNRNMGIAEDGERGIVSEAMHPGSDIAIFNLGTKIYQTSHQYRNPLDIPVTDDGFLKELFAIPGVREVTVDQRSIMIRKDASASWENIRPRLREVVERHLHLHY